MPDDKYVKLLGALAAIDGSAVLAETLISVFGIAELTADDRKFLTGPLVLHKSNWNDSLPDWMPPQARSERVEITLGSKPWIIGPTELACVMYGAMLDAPRPTDLSELYLWGTTAAASRHYGKSVDHYWELIGERRPITDDDVCSRNGRLWHTYQPLADEIRRKVMAHAPKIERRPSRQVDSPPASPKSIVQLSLF